MALSRRNTELENLDEDLKHFSNCLTSYAFKFVQVQSSRHVQVLKLSQFRLRLFIFSPVWVYHANIFSWFELYRDIEANVVHKGATSDLCVDEDEETTNTNTENGQLQLDCRARGDTPTKAEDL